MLRSEVRWFPRFLRLVDQKIRLLSSDHPDYETLTCILACDSCRRVYPLLREKDINFRFEIIHLRTRARLITDADRDRKCYYYWHLYRHGTSSSFLFPHTV